MILLHELTKIFIILKKSKRFSTTDIGKLIFKISCAKHDEQHLRGSVCVNLNVFVNSNLLQVVHHRLLRESCVGAQVFNM
ncbi:hypothetical protein HanIR_Chr17g0894041 [Helianthus annuus]|nr:hypothetical protein HanIR_Chr17g0894041 [Helianthus annuus]